MLLAVQLTSHGSVQSMNMRFFYSSKCTDLLLGLPLSYETGTDGSLAGLWHVTDCSQPPSA